MRRPPSSPSQARNDGARAVHGPGRRLAGKTQHVASQQPPQDVAVAPGRQLTLGRRADVFSPSFVGQAIFGALAVAVRLEGAILAHSVALRTARRGSQSAQTGSRAGRRRQRTRARRSARNVKDCTQICRIGLAPKARGAHTLLQGAEQPLQKMHVNPSGRKCYEGKGGRP